LWNVFTFPEFFDYMIDNNFIDKNTSPRFNIATNPWYSNIMIMPVHIKQRLIEKYSAYMDKYSYNQEVVNGFSMIVHNLKQGDENKEGIKEFIAFNEELDQFRDERLEEIIPELKEVYDWARS